ncbi:hypothetical protein LEMLEM_LOCUS8462 [Lemmus lemmus]
MLSRGQWENTVDLTGKVGYSRDSAHRRHGEATLSLACPHLEEVGDQRTLPWKVTDL